MLSTPRGDLLAKASDDALLGLWYCGKKNEPSVDSALLIDATSHPLLRTTDIQLGEYFRGERRVFDIPLAFEDTELRMAVWHRLCQIPFGDTVSYGEIARDIGRPRAYRAVGTAVGLNPISIVVPCHRVLPASGKLGNYGGGVENKRALLHVEGIDL